MSNPILNTESLKKSNILTNSFAGTEERMTVKGTMIKTLTLFIILVFAGAFSWKIVNEAINPASMNGWLIGGLIVGFILAMIISFKPKTAPVLSPFYAAAEGIVLGVISALYNGAFAETAPNIIINAVLLTLLCALIVFLFYRTGFVKINGKFMRIMMVALTTVMIYYLGTFLLSIFGVNLSALEGSSPLSIAISCIITGIAAFSLITDYHSITTLTEAGVSKQYEWYCAFGLMVTLVWLYLEILRLLGKLNSRD